MGGVASTRIVLRDRSILIEGGGQRGFDVSESASQRVVLRLERDDATLRVHPRRRHRRQRVSEPRQRRARVHLVRLGGCGWRGWWGAVRFGWRGWWGAVRGGLASARRHRPPRATYGGATRGARRLGGEPELVARRAEVRAAAGHGGVRGGGERVRVLEAYSASRKGGNVEKAREGNAGHPRDVGTPTEARRIRGARAGRRGRRGSGGGGGGEASRRRSCGVSRIAPARDAHGASAEALARRRRHSRVRVCRGMRGNARRKLRGGAFAEPRTFRGGRKH